MVVGGEDQRGREREGGEREREREREGYMVYSYKQHINSIFCNCVIA
jgi:hypothetical protein